MSKAILTVSPGTLVPLGTLIALSTSAETVPADTPVETRLEMLWPGNTNWVTLTTHSPYQLYIGFSISIQFRAVARISGTTDPFIPSDPVTVTWSPTAPPTP